MKILLSGADGKMGGEIIKAVNNQENYEIVCGFDAKASEQKFPIYNNIQDIKETVDVIIDFSVPKATLKILEYSKQNKIPIVIATTGFNKEELQI